MRGIAADMFFGDARKALIERRFLGGVRFAKMALAGSGWKTAAFLGIIVGIVGFKPIKTQGR